MSTPTERTEILHKNLETYFEDTTFSGQILVVDDHPMGLRNAQSFLRWHTRFHPQHSASTHPPSDTLFETVLIRLPKSHEYFDYVLQLVLRVVAPNTTVYVYGFSDEGVKGAQKKLAEFFDSVEPVYIKNRARIISCSVPHKHVSESSSSDKALSALLLSDFAQEHVLSYADIDYALTYYPGMFGSGMLDDGTKLLLGNAIPFVKSQQKVLDYASGSGIIAKVLLEKHPDLDVDLLDNDILSIVASRQNVPGASSFLLADSLARCPENIAYDLIISNPPIHTEKSEQFHTLHGLIEDAHHVLALEGRLILVTQARIKLEEYFEKSFKSHRVLAETTRFKVWEGSGPK